jgi:hypothetical protein
MKTNTAKKRISRYQRTSLAPRMRLTERDKQVVCAVYEHRLLRRDQIERLFFTQASTCNQRLMRLYQHGYLDRIFRPVSFGSSQAVYALDKNGADLVAQELGMDRNKINWKRKNNKVETLFMEHTLAINDCFVNLVLSIRESPSIDLLFWEHESKELQDRVPDTEGKQKYLTIAPDAFFAIRLSEGKSFFFLEVDMGTMTLTRFRKKIIAYRQFWKTGKYRAKFGFSSFRVLIIATSSRRLENLEAVTREAGGRGMFIFSEISLLIFKS